LTRSGVQHGNTGKKLYVKTYTMPQAGTHEENQIQQKACVKDGSIKARNFLISEVTITCLRRALYHQVSYSKRGKGKVKRKGCRWREEMTIASTRIKWQGFVQVRSSSKK
jgi:hypothetical protein